MKKNIKESCGSIEFEFELLGKNIAKLETDSNLGCCHYYLLETNEEYIDAVFIIEDTKGISYRVVFFQLKPNPGLLLKDFKINYKTLLTSLPSVQKKQNFLADALSDFASQCFELNCTFIVNGLLLRPGEKIEPISAEDRKSAGLAGIPLDILDAVDAETEMQFLARVYSGGTPPLILVQDNEFTFPTRGWFPAGLMSDWQPWKQNVEFFLRDQLVLHTAIHKSSESLKKLHEKIRNDDVESIQSVSMIRVKVAEV